MCSESQSKLLRKPVDVDVDDLVLLRQQHVSVSGMTNRHRRRPGINNYCVVYYVVYYSTKRYAVNIIDYRYLLLVVVKMRL
jgi:hypothetical protein